MSGTVIRVINLGKKYVIGHQQKGRSQHTTLRDTITNSIKSFGSSLLTRKEQDNLPPNQEEFWALKDVSFEVKQGEVVGIIGRNGAGKSTLLKILSQITEPTTGEIEITGKVASLLEVGTGFHPELTGRENIFLNGAILGMSKAEIRKKFDEIVSFAEVEKFLDTPVKHYSSGMYVRLAFAIAAHLEPEILIIDEVLAVGDMQFQDKCLGKMEDVSKSGQSVIFVSHNMSLIQKLCKKGIFLSHGEVKSISVISQAIEKYLDDYSNSIEDLSLRERKDRQGSGKARIVGFYILDEFGNRKKALESGENYKFIMEYELKSHQPIKDVVGSIAITDNNGAIVFLVRSNFTKQNLNLEKENGKVECAVSDFNLSIGTYNSILFISQGENEVLDCINVASKIVVAAGDYFGTGSVGLPSHCKVLTRASWKVK
jgi:lipopolysaccharide transport system ATP-binding protein